MPVDGYWPLAVVPLIGGVAAWTRAMSAGGAWTGALIGGAIALGTGWAGVAMLGTLLLVGTLTSTPGHRRRGPVQALCNGGVAAAAALAGGLGAAWGLAAAGGALATALSDTVAGELGQRYGRRPRALLFGRRVESGADGGMTPEGTLFGLGGALLVPLAGALAGVFDLRGIVAVAAAGFAGNLVDSVFGLTVQGRLGRHGNDWTNLVATAAGAAAAVLSLGS